MYILGIQNASDSGVCLLKDGELLEAVSEERFSRVKLHLGWPALSLQYVLDKYGLALEDIDWFAYGWHGRQNDYPEYTLRMGCRMMQEVARNPHACEVIQERLEQERWRDGERRDAFDRQMAELGVPAEKIRYVDHHVAHAWAAYACSPFESAYLFTMDGRGDMRSGLMATVTPDEGLVEHDYLVSAFDGLGFIYGQVTHYLGYKPHRHEGKVTGLAARGNPDRTLPLFKSLIDWENDSIRCNFKLYRPFYTDLRPELIAEFDKYSREDIAAGVQVLCEELVAKYVRHWIDRCGRSDIRNVCLAGGLFANVRINQVVAELDGVDNIYVFPHMGDGGLPVGAAGYVRYQDTGEMKLPMPTVYLGPDFSREEIRRTLDGYGAKIRYEELDDMAAEAVDCLVDGKVVGFFDGRMEYGPRALGARSVMYHTRDAAVNDWLNKRMDRTEFMPFAPVTPCECAAEAYDGWKEDQVAAHFMTRTYHCTDEFTRNHPAVVHVDQTARPQVVRPEFNGRYYRVVSDYCRKTGEKALINTSFNMHEEPIVCSPKDAVEALLKNMVDVLIVGDFKVVAGG